MPLVWGDYDHVAFESQPGRQHFRSLPGGRNAPTAAAVEVPCVELAFFLPADPPLAARVIEALYDAHPYEEPVILLTDCVRTLHIRGLDEDNPARFWNRPNADWVPEGHRSGPAARPGPPSTGTGGTIHSRTSRPDDEDASMIPFQSIHDDAVARLGGEAALRARLPKLASAAELRKRRDDRYLSQMCLRIFRAGLKHSVVDNKWPAFEEVFLGFEPRRVRALNDEEMEALMGDARLIRHWGKIKSVRANADAMVEVAAEFGAMGTYLAAWPHDDTVSLWEDLARRFSQLGGNSGPYFLRMVGRDTFMLSPWVMKGLVARGALEAEPKGKKGRRAAQAVFNAWAEETGRPLAHLSMTLAAATD